MSRDSGRGDSPDETEPTLDEDSAGPLAELLTDSPVSLAASRTSDLPLGSGRNGNGSDSNGRNGNGSLEQAVDLDPPTVRVRLDADAIRRIGRGAAPNAILSIVADPNADDVGEEIDPFLAVEDPAPDLAAEPEDDGVGGVDDLATVEPLGADATASGPKIIGSKTVPTTEPMPDPSRDGHGRFDGGLSGRFNIDHSENPIGNDYVAADRNGSGPAVDATSDEADSGSSSSSSSSSSTASSGSDEFSGGTRFVERRKRSATGLWAELESLPGPDEESLAPPTPVDGNDLPPELPPIDDVFGPDEAFGLRSGAADEPGGSIEAAGATGPVVAQPSKAEVAADEDAGGDDELEALFLPLEDEPGGIILIDDLPNVDGAEPATIDLDLDLTDIEGAFEPTTAAVDLAGGLRYSTESVRPGGLQWSTVVHEPAPTDHLGETLPQQASIVEGGVSASSTNLNRPPSQSRSLPSSVIELVDRRGFWAAIAGAVAVSCGLIGFAAVGRGEDTTEALPDTASEQVQTETADVDPDPAAPDAADSDAADSGVTTTAISPSVASSVTIGSDTTAPETEAGTGAGSDGASSSGGAASGGAASGGGSTEAGGGAPSSAAPTSTPASTAVNDTPSTTAGTTETTRRSATSAETTATTRRTTTTTRPVTTRATTETTRRTTTTVRPTTTAAPTTTRQTTTTIRVTSTSFTTRPTTASTTTTIDSTTTTEEETTTTEEETTTTENETTTTEDDTTTTEEETTTTTEEERTNNSTVGNGQGDGDDVVDPNEGPPGTRNPANPANPANPDQDPADPDEPPVTTTPGPADTDDAAPDDQTRPTVPDPDDADPADTVPRPGEPR